MGANIVYHLRQGQGPCPHSKFMDDSELAECSILKGKWLRWNSAAVFHYLKDLYREDRARPFWIYTIKLQESQQVKLQLYVRENILHSEGG